ncbi:hypothetical protein [Saccharopolyspora thermophila]|uniref:hypothetical protein n=1 Tax=Saccharopolyspora thermophila TaxID=89367 RepID=UPI0031F92B3B
MMLKPVPRQLTWPNSPPHRQHRQDQGRHQQRYRHQAGIQQRQQWGCQQVHSQTGAALHDRAEQHHRTGDAQHHKRRHRRFFFPVAR